MVLEDEYIVIMSGVSIFNHTYIPSKQIVITCTENLDTVAYIYSVYAVTLLTGSDTCNNLHAYSESVLRPDCARSLSPMK